MGTDGVIEDLVSTRLLAIVRLPAYERAVEVAQALLAGGVRVLEFSLSSEGAVGAVARVRQALGGGAHVGLGTVLNVPQAQEGIAAGAQFLVTPVLRPDVIALSRSREIPVLCGASSPTEVVAAHDAGADLVKVFPARLGGPAYFRDLLAPMPWLRLVAVGGVSADNAGDYLQAGAVAVGIGASLIPEAAVEAGDFARITEVAGRLRKLI